MKIDGLDQLIVDLSGFGDEAMPYIKQASDEASEIILDKAKELAPVDTGNLKKNIIIGKGRIRPGKYLYINKVTVKKGAGYYIPVELGHRMYLFGEKTNRHVKSKPFLRPAADQSAESVRSIVIKKMNEAIERLGDAK